jgi:polyisoprenoid-binding protein YceI
LKGYIFAVLLSLSFTVQAQTKWAIDASHSNIQFSVSHMVVAEVTGRFAEFSGTVITTKDDFTDAKGEVTIKTASVNTDNAKRDEHLKSDDFFDAVKYPEIKFISKSVAKADDDSYLVEGELTMKGITKPIKLEAVYKGQIKDPWGGTRAGWKAKSSLDRFDYGLTWNKLIESGGLVVGRTIELNFNVELVKQ